MAHFIAYATEGGTSEPARMLAQVHGMLRLSLWGVPSTAQLRARLLPGDGLVIAVGAPYKQFIGDAVLASRFRKLADAQRVALPPGLGFDHGLTLTRARVWSAPVSIAEIWPYTSAPTSFNGGRFRTALSAVNSADAALIVSAGMSGRIGGRGSAAVGAGSRLGRSADAEAEDDQVIATMNERRVAEGKAPLTAKQEQSVRESRRARRA
jgi:hypothetical protein